jgi:hypothetical protein
LPHCESNERLLAWGALLMTRPYEVVPWANQLQNREEMNMIEIIVEIWQMVAGIQGTGKH